MNNKLLLSQIEEILKSNQNSSYYKITSMANISALLFHNMKDLNWLGFYILENDELILGPFQGKIACSNIKVGKGVCGKCASISKTINVKNVHEFEGHIACDSASNSELVVPVFKDNSFYALIDIDSPLFNRFTIEDELFIEEVSKLISKYFFNNVTLL